MKKTKILIIALFLYGFGVAMQAQTLERVVFSSVASNNDNFQPIVGMPYGASLVGANGSLEVSAEYGQNTYEETNLSTNNFTKQANIRVYPNPTSEKINIDLSQLQENQVILRLVDVNGKEIINKKSSLKMDVLDMQNCPVGTYLLLVEVSKNKVQTYRIIKSK